MKILKITLILSVSAIVAGCSSLGIGKGYEEVQMPIEEGMMISAFGKDINKVLSVNHEAVVIDQAAKGWKSVPIYQSIRAQKFKTQSVGNGADVAFFRRDGKVFCLVRQFKNQAWSQF